MQLKYNYFGKIEVTDSQNKEAKKNKQRATKMHLLLL